jgi:cyclopropane fatty-acyl-phospholipid synthase-like methyltransferase
MDDAIMGDKLDSETLNLLTYVTMDRDLDPKRIVEAGYDRIAEQYLAGKNPDDPMTLAALERLARPLPPGAAVLDLGCGAGVPVTRWLAQRFAVTGVDLSARQLELARQHVPDATFIQAEMTALDFPPATFDAIVAFNSIIHVPRAEQSELVARLYRWLKPGGGFLANWALGAWEGADENWEGWGAPMWWSHWDQETNQAMLRDAGFTPTQTEVLTAHGETWLWVLAQKRAS